MISTEYSPSQQHAFNKYIDGKNKSVYEPYFEIWTKKNYIMCHLTNIEKTHSHVSFTIIVMSEPLKETNELPTEINTNDTKNYEETSLQLIFDTGKKNTEFNETETNNIFYTMLEN